MEFLQQATARREGSYKEQQVVSGVQWAFDQRIGAVTPQQQVPLLPQQQPKHRTFVAAGGSNSGSSTFSSEPTEPGFIDPSALSAASTQLQLQVQPALSRDPSCHSNELGALLDSNIITEQQLQQQLRQQPDQHSLAARQPALVPLMLPAQFPGDFPLDPQQQQLLRQLSGSTQHSQHSQPHGQGGASTSGSPAGDDPAGQQGGVGVFNTSPANSSQTPAADEEHGADSGKYTLPVAHLKVSCGDMLGTLLVHKARIRIYEGTDKEKEVSPTEFERLGGRSATKKWKQSIRLIGEDGGNGRPVGEWYVQMGLEAPKKPRDKDIHNATSPAANVFLDRHERHHNKTVAAAAAAVAAAAPTPRTRALRATRHSQPSGGQRGRRGQSAEDVAVPASWEEPTLAGSGSGSGSAYPPDAMGAWGGMYQQQQGMSTAASLAGASSLQFQPGANPLAVNSAADASAAAMDAAALNWSQQQQQMEATAAIPAAAAAAAYAAAVSGEYAVVPVSAGQQGLPGDTSLAVIEMGAYLQGLRSTPPWRLLPISQRPLIGTQLVPLRQLFIMMLHLGGYHGLENDERLWQEIAIQLELPAWPTPEVPDPIRILQQVYRDYLLRFETRFALQRAPPGAGAGLGAVGANPLLQQAGLAGVLAGGGSGGVQGPVGRQDHSPALSTATTQCNAAAGAGAIMAGLASALGGNIAGSSEVAAAVAAAAATNGTGLSRAQQLMQLPVLQPAISGIGDIFLDRSLSGDILDALTDLIPMPYDQGAAAAAAARDSVANGSGSSGSGSGNGSSAPERPASLTLIQAMAAQELAARHAQAGAGSALASGPTAGMGPGSGPGPAASGPGGAGPSRQQGQMSEAQRRKQQQQLLQQLQLMASEVTAGAFAGGSGSSRLKRPPPLIRCGDSDLVNLMDQVDVERILREHEQQRQQQQQQQVLVGMQQGAGAAQQQGAQPRSRNSVATVAAAGGAPATAALAEALDADMQDMLEGYLQQHDTAQQAQAPAQPPSQQQQQCREGGAGAPWVKQTEDAVSGMLEALQIEQQQQQQQQQVAAAVPGLPQHPLQHQLTQEFLPHQYKLHMQQSVGAHLMSDLLQQTGVAGSTGAPSPGNSSGPCPALLPAGTAAAAAAQQQQAQRQQQVDDAALQAFAGGLLRLTTPNSAILGLVLDSPAHKAGAAQWMDLPTTSLEGAQQAEQQQGQQPVQQQQQQERPPLRGQSDDIGALMHLW